MREYECWEQLSGTESMMADGIAVYTVTAKGDSDFAQRLLLAPLTALRDAIPQVGDDWRVVTQNVNAEVPIAPFGIRHLDWVFTIIESAKLCVGVVYKASPEED
jgi:hypothetical protein